MDDAAATETCIEECGAACCSGDIYVSESDAETIRDLGYSEFTTRRRGARVMRTDGNDDCRFLGPGGRCTIYDYRPVDCRLFPFGFELNGHCLRIVVADCPLSEQMSDKFVEEWVEQALELVASYSQSELEQYDRLPFSNDYRTVATVDVEEL